MLMRIVLLFAASWIITLTNDLFELFGKGFSGRDLILIFGGLFLISLVNTLAPDRVILSGLLSDLAGLYPERLSETLKLSVIAQITTVTLARSTMKNHRLLGQRRFQHWQGSATTSRARRGGGAAGSRPR
jgi:hypothetical protein